MGTGADLDQHLQRTGHTNPPFSWPIPTPSSQTTEPAPKMSPFPTNHPAFAPPPFLCQPRRSGSSAVAAIARSAWPPCAAPAPFSSAFLPSPATLGAAWGSPLPPLLPPSRRPAAARPRPSPPSPPTATLLDVDVSVQGDAVPDTVSPAAVAADAEAALTAAAGMGLLPAAARGGAVELSVVLCDDGVIRALNAAWRGKDVPTDVLSFGMDADVGVGGEEEDEDGEEDEEDEVADDDDDDDDDLDGDDGGALSVGEPARDPPLVLGDVVISLPTAAVSAAARGHPPAHEVRVLLVHGLLHLLGYDHERGAEAAAAMSLEESALLTVLGWTPGGGGGDGVPPAGLIALAVEGGLHGGE